MAGIFDFIPIILLLVFVAGFAWVGYEMYLYSGSLADRGKAHMEKRHISISKDGGMKVGVKEKTAEQYSDQQQGYLVKAWNLSSWPAYQSRYWNKGAQGPTSGISTGTSNPRTSSGNVASNTKSTSSGVTSGR